jgi:hypothetical protein
VRERRIESSHPPSLTKGPARREDTESVNSLTLLGRAGMRRGHRSGRRWPSRAAEATVDGSTSTYR